MVFNVCKEYSSTSSTLWQTNTYIDAIKNAFPGFGQELKKQKQNKKHPSVSEAKKKKKMLAHCTQKTVSTTKKMQVQNEVANH